MGRFGKIMAAAALAAAPQVAAAQLLTGGAPGKLADAIKAAGYRVSLEKDQDGDPMIVAAIEGIDTTILFFGCDGGQDCDAVVFRAGFDLPNGATPEAMNRWNRENLVGSAWLDDESDPFLDYFVTLAGGVSRENFLDAVDWWAVALRDFKTHIDF